MPSKPEENMRLENVILNEAKKITKYTGENSIRSGIASLISHGLIARTRNPYKYYLKFFFVKTKQIPKDFLVKNLPINISKTALITISFIKKTR